MSDLRAESADEEIVVTNLYVHPAYDHTSENAYDDIALLELATELDAPPVSVFRGDPEALGTRSGTIVGWGATDFVTPRLATYPDALHQAEVPLVPREVCNDPDSYAGTIIEGQLCAGFPEGGTDSCIGDSGGPLFVNTGARVEQVGVVSFGRGCAEPLFYGIYSDVSSHVEWMSDYVELPKPIAEQEPVDEQQRGAGADIRQRSAGGERLVGFGGRFAVRRRLAAAAVAPSARPPARGDGRRGVARRALDARLRARGGVGNGTARGRRGGESVWRSPASGSAVHAGTRWVTSRPGPDPSRAARSRSSRR